MPPAAPMDFSALSQCHSLDLTTFRHDGQPIVRTVSFAHDGERLYVACRSNAEFVRQIHENAQVEVAPCGESHGSIEAMAVVLPGDKSGSARRALGAFGLRHVLGDFLLSLVGDCRVYLEITPM